MGSLQADYAFEHVLTRDAAYGALLSHNRRLLHGLAADALAGRIVTGTAQEWELLPLLVEHLAAAGRYAEAHRRACRMLRLHADVMRAAGLEEWLARALDLWRQAWPAAALPPGEHPPSAPFLLALTEREWRCGDYPQAEKLARRALQIAEAAGDTPEQSAALRSLGVLAHDLGRLEEAETLYLQSLAVLEARGLASAVDRAMSLMNLGLVHDDRGRSTEAEAHYEQARGLFEEAGDQRGVSYALNNLGCLLEAAGRLAGARACWEEAARICRELGDLRSEGHVLASLGLLHSADGDWIGAAQLCGQALEISRTLGDPRGQAYALEAQGRVAQAAGEPAVARERFAAALEIRRSIRDPQGEAELLRLLEEPAGQGGGGLC